MKRVLFFLFINLSLFSETLWNDNAANIYNRMINYKVGDTIEIVIEENSSIDYKGTNKTVKSSNINIQGGEMTSILSFLPKGSIEENKNSQNKDQIKITNIVQGRITAVNGETVTINANKSLNVNNKISNVAITGEANFSDISGKRISSKKLINSQINITTLVDNQNIVINQNDFERFRVNPDSTTDLREDTRIRDDKKRQMLLDYFNKILNVIF
ncbi:MAG TPA: flagellar basal body L-ring protein FlgH [Spirochaetota bacterium]|nr:flagellar basal body L-ring protein FlgH [Spirochaetota bacterium]